MATTLNQPLSQALAPKRSRFLPTLLLVIGIVMALSAAAYGYMQQQRTERVTIAIRPLQFGQQITAADLATIEVPLHRPQQLAGISDPQLVVGKYVAREIGANDLVQPTMLLDRAPDQPVYPSGEALQPDMVAVPFSTVTIGPLTNRDVVNIGFNDPTGDPGRCQNVGGQSSVTTSKPGVDGKPQPYACRMITGANVLYVDEPNKIAYLELPPSAAQAVWAIQAASLQMWGERYGSTSAPLPPLERLDATQIKPDQVQIPGSVPAASATPQGTEAKP